MRITHLCLACFFPDGYSYQENMLPKFHALQGHEVNVIASLQTFDKDGHVSYMEKATSYTNEYGISVTRLDYKRPLKIYRKMKRFIGTYNALKKTNPEILFIHGCQFLDIDIVVRYLKTHKDVKVYVDNHADFSNSASNWVSLHLLHGIIWKRCAHLVSLYTTKFYGVLPARVDFLKKVYELPKEKIELLVMGADDQKVREALESDARKDIRQEYKISEHDFLIMTGGKIDMAKQQTLLLMEAVNRIKSKNVKLIVFGSVVPELRDKVNQACSDIVKYIGWVSSEETYKFFSAADLVVFPGRHSVFWEQVAGMGLPMVCKYWEGTTHVDVGGNVKFVKNDSVEEIKDILKDIIDRDYEKMKTVAQKKAMKNFSYMEIAKRSIEPLR